MSNTDNEDAYKYIATENLEPLENPEKEFKRCTNLMLSSEDWSVQFEGCNILRQVCKHSSSIVLQ